MRARSRVSCGGMSSASATRSGSGRDLLTPHALLRVGLRAFPLTLGLLLRLCLHDHGALRRLDTRLLLFETIVRPLLLHELAVALAQRTPSPSGISTIGDITRKHCVDVRWRGEGEIWAGVDTDAGAVEERYEREVA